jgi:Holliday junction resolvase RusA-like endonuclease
MLNALIVSMKTLTVKLAIRPRSLNNSKIPIRMGKSLRLADAPDFRKYKTEMLAEIKRHEKEFLSFSIVHDHSQHAIEAEWYIYVPSKEYFTLKGTISKTCIDATNAVKIMEDCLVKVLNIDDSQFIDSRVRKIPVTSDSWSVVLILNRVLKPSVVHLNDQK